MRVGFFVTCLVDLMRPSIGFAAIKLLESGGADVFVPPTQTCCGQPAYNSGDRADAIALARKVVEEFEGCDYLVAPSGSCSGMIKTHYAELFADDPAMVARVAALAAKTYELTDFLVNVLKLERVPGTFGGTITYHDSLRRACARWASRRSRARCSAKMAGRAALGDGRVRDVLRLRRHVRGQVRRDLARASPTTNASTSSTSGADAVVLGDLGCMLNIEGRLRRRGDATTRCCTSPKCLPASCRSA